MTRRRLLPMAGTLVALAACNVVESAGAACAKPAEKSPPATPVRLHAAARVVPLRTRDFLATEGVNTHLSYTDGAYVHLDRVIAALGYLGVTRVRDSMNAPGQSGSAPISSYEVLARTGIHFAFTVGGDRSFGATGGVPASPSLDQRIGYIAQLQGDVAGSVVLVEGTNEINNQPIAFEGHGTSGEGGDELDAALAMQRGLYAGVHAEPALKGVPVAYFTGYAAGTIPVGPDPVATSGLADFDTQHPYPNSGQAPGSWVSRAKALPNVASPSAPAVYTETGYSSNGGTSGNVNAEVQAKYTLDLLLDTAKSGIHETDLYELLDAYAPGSPQGDAGWGLFDPAGRPKPVATAIHTMNAILADPGPSAAGFAPSPLGVTVSSESATGNHLLMQKSDGSYVLALWDEQPIWNQAEGVQTAPVSYKVAVSISGLPNPRVVLFDPLHGIAPVASMSGPDVTVVVSDHPVFLRITPDTTP